MADGVKISSLVEATDAQMTDAGLIEAAVADTGSSTGFSSKKASLSRFAGYILNKFSGLSLAGSTQTVKAALDSLNSNLMTTLGTTIATGTDFDSVDIGQYILSDASTDYTNAPSWTGNGARLTVMPSNATNRPIQIVVSRASETFIRIKASASAWGAWKNIGLATSFASASSGTILDYVKSLVTQGYKTGNFVATRNVTDIPVSDSAWYVEYVRNDGSNIVHIRATQYNDPKITYRTYISNYQASTAFSGGWTQEPTASDIGSLSSLTTTAKTSLVAAVNEVNAAINSLVDGNEVSY